MAALVGIATSHGLRFELAASATLGRSATATIVLADPLVSSRHAELRSDAVGRYRIVDLGATHGTFVNGAKVTEALLVDGDEIIIGATRLRFEDREPRPLATDAVSVADEGHVIQHRLPAARLGFPCAADLDLPADASRDYERLRIAFEIGQALAAQHDLDELLRTILRYAFDLVPAERGAILLRGAASDLEPRVALRRGGSEEGVRLPRSILDEVVAKRVGLLSTDASIDVRFGRTASLVSEGVRAALSVPMVHDTELVGVIYLDALSAGVFGERDLEVLSMVAGQAALAVHTARMRHYLEQQERMALVAQVAAGLTHDFANVLTLVLGAAELIAHDTTVPESHRINARRIEAAATHAARLTRKLGTLARGGSHDRRSIDLGTFVGQTTELLQQSLGSRIELVVERSPGACRIVADSMELEQILLNLAFNARDAMEGHGKLCIIVGRTKLDGRDHASLVVADTGAGMLPDVAARIFDPFFTTKPTGRGTGMGLAVVHRLVTETSGRIAVESEPGKGTTFRIHWPLTTTMSDVTTGIVPQRASGEHVFVVDDDDAVREVVTAMLEHAGFIVTSAANGEEALAGLTAAPRLDIMVVDVVLVGMTGRQLVERVRANHPDARVLFVSGYTEAAEAEELTAAGAGFLAKPFNERDLVARVHAALRGETIEASRRRIELAARFATRADFLAAFDDATNSVLLAKKLARDDADHGITLTLRFDDVGHEFRLHGRLGPRPPTGMRVVFDPEESAARDLVLACARGESIPYFRRVEPRHPARLEVRLRSETGLVIVTHTQDISARGTMLTTDHRLDVGTIVALRIRFPDQAEPITLAGRVQSHVRTGPRRGLGIEFQFSSQDQRDSLVDRIVALTAD